MRFFLGGGDMVRFFYFVVRTGFAIFPSHLATFPSGPNIEYISVPFIRTESVEVSPDCEIFTVFGNFTMNLYKKSMNFCHPKNYLRFIVEK